MSRENFQLNFGSLRSTVPEIWEDLKASHRAVPTPDFLELADCGSFASEIENIELYGGEKE